jgi:hypothetical protein
MIYTPYDGYGFRAIIDSPLFSLHHGFSRGRARGLGSATAQKPKSGASREVPPEQNGRRAEKHHINAEKLAKLGSQRLNDIQTVDQGVHWEKLLKSACYSGRYIVWMLVLVPH